MSVTASEGNKLIRLNPSKIMDVIAGSLGGKLPRFKNVIIVLGWRQLKRSAQPQPPSLLGEQDIPRFEFNNYLRPLG